MEEREVKLQRWNQFLKEREHWQTRWTKRRDPNVDVKIFDKLKNGVQAKQICRDLHVGNARVHEIFLRGRKAGIL